MQQALPTTFGLKAAGWTRRSGRRPAAAGRGRRGAAGPVRRGGGHARRVVRRRASRCGRRSPRSWAWPTRAVPWHTVRLPIADLAGALGAAAGVVATIAVDVVLMAQTEVGELAEVSAARGGSSAMPHKNNPVAAISARACARRAPGPGRHAAVGHGAGARAVRRRLAQRVADADRPADDRGLGGLVAGREPGLAARGHRADGRDGGVRRGRGSWPARWPRRWSPPSARAPRTTPRRTRCSRPGRAAGRSAQVLAGRPEVDVEALLRAAAPDVGEAGAQVDAVLAEHRRLTEGTA